SSGRATMAYQPSSSPAHSTGSREPSYHSGGAEQPGTCRPAARAVAQRCFSVPGRSPASWRATSSRASASDSATPTNSSAQPSGAQTTTYSVRYLLISFSCLSTREAPVLGYRAWVYCSTVTGHSQVLRHTFL